MIFGDLIIFAISHHTVATNERRFLSAGASGGDTLIWACTVFSKDTVECLLPPKIADLGRFGPRRCLGRPPGVNPKAKSAVLDEKIEN